MTDRLSEDLIHDPLHIDACCAAGDFGNRAGDAADPQPDAAIGQRASHFR